MPIDAAAARRELDQLALAEYGTTFEKAIDVADETLRGRRIARIAGIELKRPFATPVPTDPNRSETGARQEWHLNEDLDGNNPNLQRYRDATSYKVEVGVYEVLKANPQLVPPNVDVDTFGAFLNSSHSESSWLLSLLKAAQPYLCEKSVAVVKHPTTDEQKDAFWKTITEASEELTKKVMEKGVETAASSLCALVPFLSGKTEVLAIGITFVIIHFAKNKYCGTEITSTMIQTLGLSDRYNQ
jgi:hypothetical protein